MTSSSHLDQVPGTPRAADTLSVPETSPSIGPLSTILLSSALLLTTPAWAQSSDDCSTTIVAEDAVAIDLIDSEFLDEYGGEFTYESLARVQPAAVEGLAEPAATGTSSQSTACIAQTLGHPLSTIALQTVRDSLLSQWTHLQRLRSQPAAAGSWRYFVQGSPTQQTASGGGQRTLDIGTFDLVAGVDHQLNDQWAVGGHLTLTHPELVWRGTPTNEATGEGLVAGVHTLWTPSDRTYLSAALSTQRTRYHLNASPYILEPGYSGSIQSQAVSQSSGFSLSAGHDVHMGQWTLAPYARVDWIQSRVSHFDGSANVYKGSTTQRTVGAQIQTQRPMSWGILMPHARLEFNQVMRWRVQGEVSGDQSLQALQPNPQARDRSYQQLGLGVSAVLPQGWTIFSDYDRTLNLQDVRAWRFTIGVQSSL